jgi:hypothetical protein
MTLATTAMQGGTMRTTARPDQKQIVPALALARKIDPDTDERVDVK